MRDRKFRNRLLQDEYPNPGVPADEAWAALNKMLDADTPKQRKHGKKNTPGGRRLFWYIASLVLIIPGLVWLLHTPQSSTRLGNKVRVMETKKEPGLQQSATHSSGNNSAGQLNQDNSYKNVTVNSNALKSLPGSEANKPVDAGDKTLPPSKRTASAGKSSEQDITGNNNITVMVKRKDNMPKDKEKNNGSHHEVPRNVASHFTGDTDSKGRTFYPGTGISNPAQMNDIVNKGGVKAGLNAGTYSADTNFLHNIRSVGGAEITGIASSLTQVLVLHTRLALDSSFLQKLSKEMLSMSSSKKAKRKLTGKLKSSNNKIPGLDYGFQWELPVPVQGTDYYGASTNGKANVFNLLLPQPWVSKGITPRSKVFASVNFKQQYFVNNKQLAQEVTFMAPRDTGVNKTSLYKIGGFGATIAWIYQINSHWSAGLGINYTINRSALLDRQVTNIYTGSIMSDSLYTIDRNTADWQYINKSMLAAKFELYYIFKKVNVGASASLPVNTIPVYGTKTRPANAQLFIRWNIK